MDNIILVVVAAVVGLAIGFAIAKTIEKGKASKTIANARKEAEDIIKEAKKEGENIKKDKIFQAKEKFLELKAEHEKVIINKDKKINEAEKRTRDKESQVSSELAKSKKLNDQLQDQIKDMEYKAEILEKKQAEVEKLHKSQVQQLEVISGLSAEDAKAQLMESLKETAKSDAMAYLQNTLEEAKLTAQQEARKIVINTIQRIGTEEAVENCVSVFNLESDDVKGRIIGREGRNIRALEAATGVEIIVDDTPEAIILSCFDSVRREVARLSLHRLVTDGRIHPARIEGSSEENRKADQRGDCGNRKTYRNRPGYPWSSSRIDQSSGSNEISFILRTKPVAALQGSSQTLWRYGRRIGTEPQTCQTGRTAARYRKGAYGRSGGGNPTRYFRYAMGRKIRREERGVQRHWCPPRRNRNDHPHFPYCASL